MSDTIRILSGTLVLLSFAAPLRAETVTATGIMESVDATAGTITVRRKTATGEKTAQFKITRATKILFDGAVSALHQFAVGQKVSIVYDTKAKQVTKLEAWSWNAGGPSSDLPPTVEPADGLSDTSSRDAGCTFFILHISETGDCIAELTREAPPPAQGTRLQIASLPGTETVKTQTGLLNVRHDFAKCDLGAFEAFRGANMPVAMPEARDGKAHFQAPPGGVARMQHSRSWQAPLSVCISVADFGVNTLGFGIGNAETGETLDFRVGSEDGMKASCNCEAFWFIQPRWEERRTLIKRQSMNKTSFVRRFRLPVPNARMDHRFRLGMNVTGATPVNVKSITINGRLIPLFGIGLEARGDTVFASQVIAKSPAEAAGVREGDVVMSINGEVPGSAKEAASLLSKVAIGDAATLVVRRAGVEKTISVKAD